MNLLLKNFLIPTQKPVKKVVKRAYNFSNAYYDAYDDGSIPIISSKVVISPLNPRCPDCKTIMDEHVTYITSYFLCPECHTHVYPTDNKIGFDDIDVLGIHGKGIQCY